MSSRLHLGCGGNLYEVGPVQGEQLGTRCSGCCKVGIGIAMTEGWLESGFRARDRAGRGRVTVGPGTSGVRRVW